MDHNKVDATWASKQAFGTYIWVASTWWYHQRHFLKSKNALNLAFFSGATFFGSIALTTMISTNEQHLAF